MAAPEYVPASLAAKVYSSPPRRAESWLADRPGDRAAETSGERLGAPGPDQGYALKLVRQFDGRLHLADGEDIHDVEWGTVAVAMRRSSLFGRAPVIHDLTVAFTIFGFLDDKAPAELVEMRRSLFQGVHHPVHYVQSRAVADSVTTQALLLTPSEVDDAYRGSWQRLFNHSVS
ncbi:MAG: hypothetical protein V3V01_20620 [Acidimicrobiales bacterium]